MTVMIPTTGTRWDFPLPITYAHAAGFIEQANNV